MSAETTEVWMARALALAKRGRGRVAPNPMVGAVIVRDGKVLAEGWHHAPGLAHGEVDALNKVDGRAPGATMFVNLEPCCHHGRTPPCTDAILASGITRVVVGMVDPDPRVSGKGLRILRDAGLDVVVGVAEEASRRLNAPYLTALAQGRPWVLLKAGITLDGRIASAAGESQWITSVEGRRFAHSLRDQLDAVLVGSGTLLADDPSLNTRTEGGRDAVPVILDTELRCPDNARVLTAGEAPLFFCAEDAPERVLSAELVRVPRAEVGLSLPAVLAELARRGLHSLLVEGGGRIHRSFMDADLVDAIELVVAPKILAGGPGWVGGAPFSLAEAPAFTIVEVGRVGRDARLRLERET